MGSHAQLLALNAKSFTGIDLTERAVRTTQKRLELANVEARILQLDAEKMPFTDQSFDFIWSWGVIHHSANTLQILREMHRVLRPGGQAVVMVYHRSFWKYYLEGLLIRGIILGKLGMRQSLHGINQVATDGAIARFYRPDEWRRLCAGFFTVDEIIIAGPKSDVVPLPRGAAKTTVMRILPAWFTRFLTQRLQMGSFLIAKMQRA